MWQMFFYKSRTVAIVAYLSFEQSVFTYKSYFCFCSVLAKKRFFVQLGTLIELLVRISNNAPLILCVNIHEISILAFIRIEYGAWIIQNLYFADFCKVFFLRGLSVRHEAMRIIKEMYLYGTCSLSLKNWFIFGQYWPETEICFFNKNRIYKRKKNVDCHGRRPLLNNRHLSC